MLEKFIKIYLHSGNVLFKGQNGDVSLISDLGTCQPADNEKLIKKEVIYGVLPYVAPEVLCGSQYTKEADIYSFGIIMNEFISEEMPYNDVSHDHILTIKIYQDIDDENSVLYSQVKECEKIRENKSKSRLNENRSKNIQTYPQAIYTSRLLNFKNLPESVNSSELSEMTNSLILWIYLPIFQLNSSCYSLK